MTQSDPLATRPGVAGGAAGYTALLGGMIYHCAAGNARPTAWDSASAPPATRPLSP
jgi:hypothetical protein